MLSWSDGFLLYAGASRRHLMCAVPCDVSVADPPASFDSRLRSMSAGEELPSTDQESALNMEWFKSMIAAPRQKSEVLRMGRKGCRRWLTSIWQSI